MTQDNAYKAPLVEILPEQSIEANLSSMPFKALKKLYHRSCNIGAIAVLVFLGIGISITFSLKLGSIDGEFWGYYAIISGAFNAVALIGIILRTKWGRIMGMIVSALMLISFPLGTIIGIFGLFAFVNGPELFGPNRIKHGPLKIAFKQRKAQGEQ